MDLSALIKILLVEDRPEDADLIVRELRRSGLSIDSRRVDSPSAYEHALAAFAPDLILSDYTLPGFDGSEALRIAQRRRPDTPFIFVSGTIGEERAIETLKQGAVDYVLKDNRARLAPAVERALKDAEERQVKRWAMRKLEESEERFRFAMHYSSIGMALVDPNGRWLGVNPALCKILGYGEAELMSRDVLSITHPEDRFADAPAGPSGAAAPRGRLPHQQALHPQGRRRGVDRDRRIPGLAAGQQTALLRLLGRSRTSPTAYAQKRSWRSANSASARSRNTQGIGRSFSCRPRVCIEIVNPQFRDILGYAHAGRSILDLVSPEVARVSPRKAPRSGARSFGFAAIAIGSSAWTKDGSRFWCA